MKIKVKHIYNTQAVVVKGNKWDNWRVFFQNTRRFGHENARLNKLKLYPVSNEALDGLKGDY